MSDQRAIADALTLAARYGEDMVVASVVRTAGATYRGVGARMVVRADDTTVGLLSGGCLEAELVQQARRVRESGEPSIFTYDGRSDDEPIWGLGLGCNGLVEILLERRTPTTAGTLGTLLLRALEGAAPSVIATVTLAQGQNAPAVGARVLVRSPAQGSGRDIATDLEIDGDWGSHSILSAVVADARGTELSARRGLNLDYVFSENEGKPGTGVTVQVAFELVVPSLDVVICGSGPDAIPVARLATALGWRVTVIDPRPVTFTPPARFGEAHVVECAHSEQLGHVVLLTSRTAAIVMSHSYERDLDYLDAIIATDVAYIGILGPRGRTARLLRDLAARGRPCSDSVLERIYGPIGLDVGGDGPEAIALSIVAELSAVMNGRAAAHLRDRAASVHDAPVVA
jgi:xanthine dehydrogenase accessory factor